MQHVDVRRETLGPVSGFLARLLAVLEGMAFWTAATFPVAHLGAVVLYARGSLSVSALVGLLAVHVAAIVAGHRHNRLEDASDE